METGAGCVTCRAGKMRDASSQGERGEGAPELGERTTPPSASGCAWPPRDTQLSPVQTQVTELWPALKRSLLKAV